ncbi:MAG: AAA family ATPase [Mariprofundaceae bacterium]|nr:AAA family ATPase [Mariprofundaceae bacterium]
MLPSFHIKNFRAFDTLTVKRLSRVNLIVGKNNVGKSAFLDAIALYNAKFSKKEVEKQLIRKQEVNAFSDTLRAWSPLFHGYNPVDFMGVETSGIKLSLNHDDQGVSLKACVTDNSNSKSFMDLKKMNLDDFNQQLAKGKNLSLGLVITADNYFFNLLQSYSISLGSVFDSIPIVYVSTHGLTDDMASRLLDRLNLTKLPPQLIHSLRLLDPRIEQIAFADVEMNDQASQRIPFIKLKNINEPIPLKSLGDGLTRVFHIMLAMMNAKDGILLIDEFENGLHWSVQEEVWEKIFVLAEKLNVQVFATTHSCDCVQAFSEVWNTQADQGAYFRLFQRDDHIQVQEYDARLLANSITCDAETR